MLLKDTKVLRPSKTKIQTKNNIKYVYAVTSISYNADKKYSSDTRVCIGKMIDDKYMIPNDKFIKYYPDSSIEVNQISRDFSDSLSVGNVKLIDKVFNDTYIYDILVELFDSNKANIIKDLISYIIFEESCVFEYFEFYERRNITSTAHIYSDSRISSLLKDEISFKDIQTFLEEWNKLKSNELNDVFLNIDATNINVRNNFDGLGEYGYAKDDDDLPQINLTYVSSNTTGTPLSYELYPGSIHDSNEVNSLLRLFNKYGYTNIGLIFDRAYYSLKLVKALKKKGYSYIFMLKENYEYVRNLIDKHYIELTNQVNCYLGEYELSYFTSKVNISEDKKKPLTAYLNIYYNDKAHANHKAQLLNSVAFQEKELKQLYENNKTLRKEDLIKYSKYFIFKYDVTGYLLEYQKNTKSIQEEMKYYGFFAILSSKEYSGLELLNIYRNRDSVEKLFRALKSSFEFDHTGVHYKSSLESKVFITFIASIIRNEIFRKSLVLDTKERKRFTVPIILKTLSEVEATLNTNDNYFRKYALTKDQRKLLGIYDIKEKDIDEYIQVFNNKLASK